MAQRSTLLNVSGGPAAAAEGGDGERAGTVVRSASLDWFKPAEGWPAGQYDVALAADVLYDKRFAPAGKQELPLTCSSDPPLPSGSCQQNNRYEKRTPIPPPFVSLQSLQSWRMCCAPETRPLAAPPHAPSSPTPSTVLAALCSSLPANNTAWRVLSVSCRALEGRLFSWRSHGPFKLRAQLLPSSG